MGNKEVEKLLQDKQALEKRTFELERCIKRLQGGKQNREARIRNLEKKLEAKDKALDKACEFIENIGVNKKWQGIPQCENCANFEGICWDCKGLLKETFENGID